jgi:hypothetical protein
VAILKRMFKWAASAELAPSGVYHRLPVVEGLRRGRSAACETGPVLPVEVALVERTLPHLPPHVAGIRSRGDPFPLRRGVLVLVAAGGTLS